MKHNWWETEIARFIFLQLSASIALCLYVYQNEFWIGLSGIYVLFVSVFYFVNQGQKNEEVKSLYYRIDKLERYNKWLEKELEKAYTDSQQD